MSAADDRLIWALVTGTRLTAKRDLHENLDAAMPRWFTGGRQYRVESMHPIADPPFVRVKCDDGTETKLYAEHIRADFVTPNGEVKAAPLRGVEP